MKQSEKKLAIVFVFLLAIIGGLVLFQQLQGWSVRLNSQDTQLNLKEQEAGILMDQGPLWQEREAWLNAHQPPLVSELEADEQLKETVKKKAAEAGVQVLGNQLQPPVKGPYYEQHGVTLTVTGDLKAVMRWVYSLQSPTEFRVVPSIKITPDKKDPSKVVCAIQFWKWYSPDSTKNAS